MVAPPRTLVLGDLHLSRHSPPAVADDLARFVEAHPGARIVFAGDLLDLSVEPQRRRGASAIEEAFGVHPSARAALARHVDGGGELWMVSGNHDAALGHDEPREALLRALGDGPNARARVRTSPWFFREGGLHVEHGHFFDPDNAPAHPLVDGQPSLGVHFTEEFIAPTGAHRYLNANDGTPLELLVSSFSWYGRRAPYVIYRYFHAALGAMLRSGPFYRADSERAQGRARLEAFAEAADAPLADLEALLGLRADPTLESVSRTFTRLYFDRVIATLAMSAGATAAGLGARRAGGAAFSLGALLMTLSWARGHDRYAGTVEDRLAEGAERVAGATGARLVVFGHTHREALGGSYANTGSFAFPREAPGRPFLEIEGSPDQPRAARRYWT